MRIETVIETTCDVPACATTVPGEPTPDWFIGSASMGGKVAERHVCPHCAGNLIDPADDIAAEVRRFDLEGRIA